MEQKREIRREVRQRIKAMDEAAKERAAATIFERVEGLDSFRKAQSVALYAAMGDEVPTARILDRWCAMGKHIVVPRVEGDVMRFYDYAAERMQSGAYGILEPVGDEEYPASDIDLIVVPARAFTLAGARLGRGGGFYDKYMSQPDFRAHKVGIAFGCQIFESLPTDPHDILVDEVITDLA